MNVSPAEVEDVLMLLPEIQEAFVTALPDPARDQIVGAVLLPSDGASIDLTLVLEHCRRYLAPFKVPKQIRLTSRALLPQTSTGKVHKLRLPELFEDYKPIAD